MTWNYRLTRETLDGEHRFAVREIYYDEAGTVNGWTADPVYPVGDTWLEAVDALSMYSGVISLPVLDIDTKTWLKPGRSADR